MAVTITPTADEPTVVEWSAGMDTAEFHQTSGTANWYSKITFSIARVANSRNIAIRAEAKGKAGASDLANQGTNATPRVRLNGENTWAEGSNLYKATKSTKYITLGTLYFIIEGAQNGDQFDCNMKSINSYITLDSPIKGPAIFVNAGGTIVQADAVFVNAGGTVVEVDGVFLNVNGTIVQS